MFAITPLVAPTDFIPSKTALIDPAKTLGSVMSLEEYVLGLVFPVWFVPTPPEVA